MLNPNFLSSLTKRIWTQPFFVEQTAFW